MLIYLTNVQTSSLLPVTSRLLAFASDCTISRSNKVRGWWWEIINSQQRH